MRKKLALTILLLTLLSPIVAIKQVGAPSTAVVSVDPSEITVQNVGETFTIKINISDVTDLAGYDFKLYYNNTLLKALSIAFPLGHFLTPTTVTGQFYVQAQDIHQDFNSTHGQVRVVALLLHEPAKSGSGVLVTVTFNATAKGGPSKLELSYPNYEYPVKLSDPDSVRIPCTATPAYVTVLPEFSTIVFMVVLMVATLVAVIFGRTSWLKKRRGSFVAG